MKKLHIAATGLVAALAMVPLSTAQAEAHHRTTPSAPSTSATFTLNAKVLDGGQQITSITINAPGLKADASSLAADTFTVHAKGTSPFPAADTGPVLTEFDANRVVTGVHARSGKIVVDLKYGFGVTEANTFGYGLTVGRNLIFDLAYTVTQNKPITLRDGTSFTFSALSQGKLKDPEVDAFRAGSSSGLNYWLYTPSHRGHGKHPLVIWLHGGGEGGWAQAPSNNLPLIANRGALGFITPKAQRIFGGAYVLAPQATDYWLNDPAMGYSAKLKALIDSVVKHNRIDRSRIYVVGASNGGYMTPRLVVDNPGFFAAEVPTCPVVSFNGTTMLTDAELAGIKTPTWVVQAKTDDTVPFEANGKHLAETVPGALLSAYDDVTFNGVTYPTHWSWIYVARNDPTNARGQHLWQWMAAQSTHPKGGTHHHHHR
jgi:predicted peptidase